MNILGAVDGTSGTGAFVLGHWNYTTSVNVSGVLNILNAHIGVVSATNATLNINEGGVVNIKGLDLAYKRDAAAKIAVVLNEGGMINMGEDGIGKTTGTADAFTLTLNGGTLGILNTVDSWTGVKAMTIGGSVTLNTDKYTPDTTAQGSDYDGYL